jgi:hypothetical protein
MLNLSPIDLRDFSDLEPCQMGNGRDTQKPANVQGAYSSISTGKLYDKNRKQITTRSGIAQAAGALNTFVKTRAGREQVRSGIAAATRQVAGNGRTNYGSAIGPVAPQKAKSTTRGKQGSVSTGSRKASNRAGQRSSKVPSFAGRTIYSEAVGPVKPKNKGGRPKKQKAV